jgi:hypothetical protein
MAYWYCFGTLTTMDAVLATNVNGGQAICQNIILIINTKTRQSTLVGPFGRGFLHWIGLIHRSHPMGGANGTPW